MYLLYVLTRFGFSLLQGPHQDAQKSIMTYFPRREDNFKISSLGLLYAYSGALSPIFIDCALTLILEINNNETKKKLNIFI